jgi:hypothetical protein
MKSEIRTWHSQTQIEGTAEYAEYAEKEKRTSKFSAYFEYSAVETKLKPFYARSRKDEAKQTCNDFYHEK